MIGIPKNNLFKSLKNNWAGYVLILMLLTFSSCKSIIIKENKMSDDAVQNIVGKVKIMEISTINESKTQKNNGINSDLLINYFNKKGKILRQEYRHDAKYSDTTLFSYHKNMLIKATTTSNSISPVLTIEHKYDKKNNEIEFIAYTDKTLDYKILKKYDSKGNIIKKQHLGKNDKLEFTEIYLIDYKKKSVIVNSFDSEGKQSSYYSQFEYDSQGNRIKYEIINNKPDHYYCTVNQYDQDSNLLKSHSCKSKRNELEYKYTFDAIGNIIKRAEYHDNILMRTKIIAITYW